MELENEEKKSYYAIIPGTVRYDKRITANAKLLYGEITALCNEKGYCWARNEYFSSLYDVSKQSISTWINQLKKCGYIKTIINYKQGTKEILSRYISIIEHPIQENLNTPIQENLKDNITSFLNNTSNIKSNIYTDGKKSAKLEESPQSDNIPLFPDEIDNTKNMTKSSEKEEHSTPSDFRRAKDLYSSNYDILYTQGRVKTKNPIISWAKAGKILKDSLIKYGANVVVEAIEKSIKNDYCISNGYGLSIILSDSVMNSLINGSGKNKQELRVFSSAYSPNPPKAYSIPEKSSKRPVWFNHAFKCEKCGIMILELEQSCRGCGTPCNEFSPEYLAEQKRLDGHV